MPSKKNKFPGADLNELVWIMSYFNSLKSFSATILKEDQFDVIEPFLKPQLEEDPNFIHQFGRVNLLTLHMEAEDYRGLISELAPEQPELSNGRVYVWITFTGDNMFVVILNKVVYVRKKKKNTKKDVVQTKKIEAPLKLDALKEKLKKALENEHYEVAAELRDKINCLDGTQIIN